MDAREQIKQAIMQLPKLAAELESKDIKPDIDLLMGVTSQLVTVLVNRNAELAKRRRPSKAKTPKSSPAKGPQQHNQQPSDTDTQQLQNDAEDRSQALSSIQQGIRQADPTLDDQQNRLRNVTYGQNDDERSFRLAAKAIAS